MAGQERDGESGSRFEDRVDVRQGLLGRYLHRAGAITDDQCEMALERQRDLDAAGEHRLIGEILIEMEAIGVSELQRALDAQWHDDLASPAR